MTPELPSPGCAGPARAPYERFGVEKASFYRMTRPFRVVGGSASPAESTDGPLSFEAFFEAESRILFRRLCLVTGNRHEAEEVMQDAFISLLERWDRVRLMQSPTGYLYRTAFHAVSKRARRATRALQHTIRVNDPVDEFEMADDREVVRRALGSLTRRQRTAVVLTELLGYTSEDAAKIMGARATTVRVLASNGRAVMRRALEEGPDA